MFEGYMFQASSYAADIDNLIWLIAAFTGFWFILAEVLFFGLIFKFRARSGVKTEYITGKEPHLKKWITIPHFLIIVCDVFIVWGSFSVWTNVKLTLPEADTTVRVIGQQWAWVFQHPGSDNELDTADDIYTVDDLFVENGKSYHYLLESRDVLHNFSVPVFRLKQDAIPGRRITGWFEPTQAGSYDIQCAEICGIAHGAMYGRIHVQGAAEHAAWVASNSPVSTEPVPTELALSALPAVPPAESVSGAATTSSLEN
jgi:cytochrome c oxidase subunit 2